MLGLGWAMAPMGLKDMKALKKIQEEEVVKDTSISCDEASDEMCMFMVINISSLQLISINMIAYRSQYGSDGLLNKDKVYDIFVDGVKEGFKIVVGIVRHWLDLWWR